jgi:hypothetical protein
MPRHVAIELQQPPAVAREHTTVRRGCLAAVFRGRSLSFYKNDLFESHCVRSHMGLPPHPAAAAATEQPTSLLLHAVQQPSSSSKYSSRLSHAYHIHDQGRLKRSRSAPPLCWANTFSISTTLPSSSMRLHVLPPAHVVPAGQQPPSGQHVVPAGQQWSV